MTELADTLPDSVTRILVLLAVVGARPMGFVMLHPIFGRFGISSGVLRGAVIVAMVAPVLPGAAAMITADPGIVAPAAVPGLILAELFIGALLGLMTGIPFWAASAAGDLIDNQRSASMANLMDPQSSGETSVTGTLLFLTCILVLAAEGVLFPTIFGPLMESYRLFPALSGLSLPDPRQGALALGLLDQLLRAGVIMALPILIPLLLTEIVVAIATKYTQQINAMFLSMSIKQGVNALLMLVYTVLLASYAMSQIGQGPFGTEALAPFLRGSVDE
ncbi:EscT/YscT/HrcT family type III secretion system export apparatus protein [Paracoccus sediminicola]|uniref:EscT/YscT/HrcT family type III secretion system export apparatus protein n=1 Tax=Paracoccus sediminicola TaxID=3017783 RepID=UPI0022EFDBF7|nr:flagellar biosynthetic protein FliR [Paracoccus sediminicola]WBU57188.1 flagellar biosynthetic protein FliR [Paracoccus sediminicola]